MRPTSAGTSRTAMAPPPKGSIARPSAARSSATDRMRAASASGSSTISGISSACAAMPFASACAFQAFIDQPLMRGVLVDDDDAGRGLGDDPVFMQLRPRGAKRRVGFGGDSG